MYTQVLFHINYYTDFGFGLELNCKNYINLSIARNPVNRHLMVPSIRGAKTIKHLVLQINLKNLGDFHQNMILN